MRVLDPRVFRYVRANETNDRSITSLAFFRYILLNSWQTLTQQLGYAYMTLKKQANYPSTRVWHHHSLDNWSKKQLFWFINSTFGGAFPAQWNKYKDKGHCSSPPSRLVRLKLLHMSGAFWVRSSNFYNLRRRADDDGLKHTVIDGVT